MKLRNLTGGVRSDVKGIHVNNEGEIQNYTPTFKPNEVIKLLPNKASYSSDLQFIVGREVTVSHCKLADLYDMLVEVVYLEPDEEGHIRNPYLVEHFKRIDNGESNTT